MKKIIAIAASAIAFCAVSVANAAVITFTNGQGVIVNETTMDVLSETSDVNMNVQGIENGADGLFSFTGDFMNSTSVEQADGNITVIQFLPTALGRIADLVLTFSGPGGTTQSFAITDSNGAPIAPVGNDVAITLNLSGFGNIVSYIFEGRAIPSSGNNINPGIQMVLSDASEVPLPAALPFFLMGVAAYGASKRRNKTA